MFSIGRRSIRARTTVNPPTPESNTPIGRECEAVITKPFGLKNAYCNPNCCHFYLLWGSIRWFVLSMLLIGVIFKRFCRGCGMAFYQFCPLSTKIVSLQELSVFMFVPMSYFFILFLFGLRPRHLWLVRQDVSLSERGQYIELGCYVQSCVLKYSNLADKLF